MLEPKNYKSTYEVLKADLKKSLSNFSKEEINDFLDDRIFGKAGKNAQEVSTVVSNILYQHGYNTIVDSVRDTKATVRDVLDLESDANNKGYSRKF